MNAPSPPLRVLVVSGFGVLGGAEQWLLRLLGATRRLEVEAILLADGPLVAELEKLGIPVSVVPTGPRGRDLIGATVRVFSAMRQRRPEVVLANGVKGAAAAIPASRLAGVPVVWCKHDQARDASLARPLALGSDRVVAVSPQAALATGRSDVVIIPPPRPEPPVSVGEARDFWASIGVPVGERPAMVMATRLLPMKGVDDAIASLALPGGRAWQLTVVGDDDYSAPGESERLRRLAARLGVAGRVHFCGRVEEAGRWLGAFDAVAVLSKRGRGVAGEGFGIGVLEAMLAGVPVIATKGVAAAEAIDGKAGLVVPPGSPEAVAGALSRLAEPGVRSELGATGRRLACAHPDTASCSARLVAALAETAGRPGAGLAGGPPVSVVTTVLNEEVAIVKLLEALRPQLGDDDELIVVDGGSRDATPDQVAAVSQHDPRVRLVSAPGANIAQGRNLGVEKARREVIACTDAGCRPDPGWLDALRRAFADIPRPDLVTGIYRVQASRPFEHALAVANYPDPEEARRMSGWARAYGSLLGRVYAASLPTGRSMAFWRPAWREAGGFSPQLGTADDVEFGRALAAAGRRCTLQLDAEVDWEQRPSVAATAAMYYRYGFGDGEARDSVLVGRNLARLLAYSAGPFLLLRGRRPGRLLALAGAALYLSLPLARARRRPRPVLVALLVPAALAVKDLSKAAGCLRGLARGRTDAPSPIRPRSNRG